MLNLKKRVLTHQQKTKLRRLRKHPFVIPVAVFLLLFFLSIGILIDMGGQTVGANDTRVVKLYVDRREQVVPTRAKTVNELLNRLSIQVNEQDIIEPGLDTEITDTGFAVNIYRARTVLIEDGLQRSIIFTAEPTPQRVAEKAGMPVLHPEDRVTKVAADIIEPLEAIHDGVVSERLVIVRAVPATINLYGNIVTVRTHSVTVEDLLTEKGIKINEGDTIQPSPGTLITPNTQIMIARFGTELAQVEEEIAPPVENVDDFNLTLGASQVREPGRPGKRIVTYEIELTNGVETSRKIIQEAIIEEPVKRVVAKGRKAPVVAGNKAEIMAAAGIPANEFYAADYIISHESGWRVNAMNASGCAGLGQACPGSKLRNACPSWESDPVCQMRFFNGYAVGRYGNWIRAFETWQRQRWW